MVLQDIKSEEYHSHMEQESLMSKYKIPVQHFEYSYIEKCDNGRELERIVQILKSGEEGYFPDLTRFAENRLAVVKPKSKLLRKVCPVLPKDALSREERNELTNEITQWIENISKEDDELTSYKNRKLGRTLPEVRETKNEVVEETKKSIPKRISSTDYSSWDKYDVDTEILKMDLEDEALKKEAVRKEKKKPIVKKSVQFKEFTTDIEALHEANYEKDKGNEFFKAGDYREALRHYTNSINFKATLAAFTNRALMHIKLKNYKNAIADCHSALAIDPDNLKAFVRKAQALEGLQRYQEALETVEQAIEIDPNNTIAQDLAQKLRKQCGVVLKNTRFAVQDVERDKKNENKRNLKKNKVTNEIIIPIPGTSNMSPPYYITCSEHYPQKVKEEILKASTPPQIMHLVTANTLDVEDDDCCTVNHLQEICTNNDLSNSTRLCEKYHHLHNKNRDRNQKVTPRHNEIDDLRLECGNKSKDTIAKRNIPFEQSTNSGSNNKNKDYNAGGEPCILNDEIIDMPEDIHSPYSFLKTWNSANTDETLEQHASILRSIDMNRIIEVVGCKLDNAMFSKIVKCLAAHFAVPGEVERLHSVLENLVNLPRFDIIAMLMSSEDRKCVNALVNFLKQHGMSLCEDIVNKLLNN